MDNNTIKIKIKIDWLYWFFIILFLLKVGIGNTIVQTWSWLWITIPLWGNLAFVMFVFILVCFSSKNRMTQKTKQNISWVLFCVALGIIAFFAG